MADNLIQTSGGVSLPTLTFIVFLLLKLTDTIDWSWWWVTSPLWISLILGLIVVATFMIMVGWD